MTRGRGVWHLIYNWLALGDYTSSSYGTIAIDFISFLAFFVAQRLMFLNYKLKQHCTKRRIC